MFSQVVLDGAFGGFGSEIVKQIKAKKLLLISRNGSRNVDDTVEITNRTTTTLKVDFLSQDAVRILSQIPSFFNSDIPLIYISNAGRLQIAKTSSLREEEVETSTRINCTIPFMITSILLKVWKEKLTITNISSLNALIPTPSMSLYSSAKASREMFFNTVLAEYPIRLLHYAPGTISLLIKVQVLYKQGPMDTAMQQKIRHEMEEGQVRQEFIKLYKNNLLVSTSDSVRVLLKLIEEDSFVNGAHVDYYDIIVSDKDNRHKVT